VGAARSGVLLDAAVVVRENEAWATIGKRELGVNGEGVHVSNCLGLSALATHRDSDFIELTREAVSPNTVDYVNRKEALT
jgi:hypothetical protein